MDPVRNPDRDLGKADSQIEPQHQGPDQDRASQAVGQDNGEMRGRTNAPALDRAEKELTEEPSGSQHGADNGKRDQQSNVVWAKNRYTGSI